MIAGSAWKRRGRGGGAGSVCLALPESLLFGLWHSAGKEGKEREREGGRVNRGICAARMSE